MDLTAVVPSKSSSQFFLDLKPFAVTALENPTVDNFSSYYNKLQQVKDDPELEKFTLYILFPCQAIFEYRLNVPEKVKEISLLIFGLIFNSINLYELSVFRRYSALFNVLLAPKFLLSQKAKDYSLNEYLKEFVIDSYLSLINNCTKNFFIKRQFQDLILSTEYRTSLAFTISLLLEFCDAKCFNRGLKLKSLKLLSLIFEVGEGSLEPVSDAWSPFLPGILSILGKTIYSDQRQGSEVVALSITVWGKIISTCLNDKLALKKHQQETSPLFIERSEQWLTTTVEQVHKILARVLSVMLHPSQKVRLALCRLCGTFLRQSCNTLLKQSLDQILSVLTTYIYDNYDNVKNLAKEEINSLVSVVQDLDAHNLLIVHKLELNFRECLSSLPGLLRTSNDVNKLALVRLLCGYCEILQNRLNTLLSNPLLWNRLSVALMEVLALDDSPNTGIFDLASDISIGRRRFLHFSNANIESAVQSLCRLIGQHCDLYTSFDHFSSVLRTSTTHRKQAAYALNQIFSGAFSLVSQECHIQSPINNLVKLKELSLTFIYELISSRQFQLPVTQEESDLYDGQLPEINIWDNATLCGLLLECFGTCLKILGPECDSILYDLLYPLVEVYTSDSPSVKSSAHAVLQELCSLIFYQEERKYPNIEELLEHNFDYLIDKVSRNLRFLVDYPRTPVVLSLVVQFWATLEQFSDVLRDIILLMTNDLGLLSTQLQLYLYSFKSILVKLETCIHPEKDTIEEEAKECTCPFVHLGVSIVDHVLHYLPDDPPALRLEVLQVVAAGARALRQRPRVLMPLIHKMWPGLINRLSDDVAPVRLQTLRTIQELNVCSADFVFRRIEKDVYPSLHSILSNPPKAPDLPPLHVILVTEPVYSFAYKLRCCALEFILGWLAGYQRFSLAVLDSLMMLTLPYLHPLQPKDLFEGALEIYSLLANKHPDVLWTFAHEFTEQLDRYRPASSRLKQYGAQALAVDMRPIAQVLGNIRIP